MSIERILRVTSEQSAHFDGFKMSTMRILRSASNRRVTGYLVGENINLLCHKYNNPCSQRSFIQSIRT